LRAENNTNFFSGDLSWIKKLGAWQKGCDALFYILKNEQMKEC